MQSWDLCLKIFNEQKDNIFLVNNNDVELTYNDLYRNVEKLCTELQKMKDLSDGPVAWCGTNNFLFYIFVLSCLKLNKPVFIIYNTWTVEQIASNMEKYNISNLFIDSLSMASSKISDLKEYEINLYSISSEENHWKIINHKNVQVNETDNIFDSDIYLATSGTTKSSKWVGHSCEFIFDNMKCLGEHLRLTSRDRMHSIMPLYTSNGVTITFFLPFVMGMSVFQDDVFLPFSLNGIFKRGYQHKATVMSFVPSVVNMINRLNWEDCGYEKSYNFCICGTSALHDDERIKFEHLHHIPIYTNYGLTEVLFVSSQNEKYHQQNSNGHLLKNVSIKYVDNEIYVEVKEDTPVYLGDSEKEAFFATGDIGELRNDELYISGRKKQLVIRGGYNINLHEIEDYILSMDFISDVVCFGIETAIHGEELYAAVVMKKGEKKSDILNTSLHKRFPKYMLPKILLINQIPRNDIGKPDYRKLTQLTKHCQNED